MLLRQVTWLLLLCVGYASAQDRNIQVAKPAAAPAAAHSRVALVIGNGNYSASPLRNPANDSRDMAKRLRLLGFDVIERQNLGREQMHAAVREFGRRLERASIGLFYFAGHGMQVKGRNYLIPVDASIEHEDEVPYRSLDAGEVLDKMESAKTRTNLVILDACRNNPFHQSFRSRRQGLAEMEAPGGTLIAFATAPGAVALDGDGANGVYTEHLLKQIEEPMPVEQMFKRVRIGVSNETKDAQIPWESSSLREDFYFRPPAVHTAFASQDSSEVVLELAFWDAIKNSTSPRDYAAYLQQYPRGRFATLAQVRHDELSQKAQPARAAAGPPAPSPAAQAPLKSAPSAVAPALPPMIGLVGVGFSADGRWLALSFAEGSVSIVNAATRFVLKRFSLGFKPATASFSPDGRLLAAGGADGQLVLIDISTAKEIRRATGGASPLVATAFSPDGRYILSGAMDGAILLRSVRTGEAVKSFNLGGAPLRDAQYAPDGRYIAVIQEHQPAGLVRILDVSSGREVHSARASAASFSVNGRFVLLAAPGNVPTLVEIATGRELRRFPPQSTGIVRGTYSEDGAHVATVDRAGAAVLWGTLSGEKVVEVPGDGRAPRAIAFSADARTVAMVDARGELAVHRLRNERK